MSSDFQALGLPAPLLNVLSALGFSAPSAIQAATIPLLLEGRDVIAQSQTGSGKTAAFSLPLLARVDLELKRLQALVLCPTRELCEQVSRELRKLGRDLAGLRVATLSGGQALGPQLAALQGGAHVAVGTPGRVVDLLGRKDLDLTRTRFLVLDEADRMLAMGFREDIVRVLKASPKPRQTAFFSATFPEPIEHISANHQHEPLRITNAELGAPRLAVEQRAYNVSDAQKTAALLRLLHEHPSDATLVFVNLKASVAAIEHSLRQAAVSVAALHGDLEQNARQSVMARFRNGSVRVLVATDVAARGLDIEELGLVINYDLPQSAEVYVHRIGRTGRAGRAGLALSLVTARDAHKLDEIEAAASSSIERSTRVLPAPDLTSAVLRQPAPMETLYISGGRKAKLRPGDILGALTGVVGLAASDVGKIEIHERFSFVAVARPLAASALERLQRAPIKRQRFKVGFAQ